VVRGEAMSISHAIGLCSDGYPANALPIFPYIEELDCVVVGHSEMHGRQQLHLAVFEQGAGAAVVETLARVRIDEEPAPARKEFIRSQVFLICSGNDVIFTTHNAPLRDSRINSLLNQMIASFSGADDAPNFLLEAVLNERRYRQIMDQGIAEIDLGLSGFQQTLEHAIQGGAIDQTGLMGVISSLWRKDQFTDEDREAASKISGRFVLRPGHDWNDIQVKEILTDMAMELVDDGSDDGFAIVTKNGLRITQDYVRLSDSFSVDGNRQIINGAQVFAGLQDAFDSFEQAGVLGDDMIIQ